MRVSISAWVMSVQSRRAASPMMDMKSLEVDPVPAKVDLINRGESPIV